MSKIGRNDPCVCGSGQKYKKCCMKATESHLPTEVTDLAWIKLRQLEGQVFEKHLMPFMDNHLPPDLVKDAAEDCMPEEVPDGMDLYMVFDRLFQPYFLYNWLPIDGYSEYHLEDFKDDMTIAENYAHLHENRLTSRERAFLDAMSETYYSFHLVEQVVLDRALVVKDILLGTEHTVKEQQGTHHIQRGDIIFGRILTMDNQSIFVGMAPYIIQPRFHTSILDFRDWLVKTNEGSPLTEEVLKGELDIELLDRFFEIMDATFNVKMPTLTNTDDELIENCVSYFKLSISAEEALEGLLPLTLSEDKDEFLSEAERDGEGNVTRLEFPWLRQGNTKNKNWENTVLGNVEITDGRLKLTVNSSERNELGKARLSELLGDDIEYQRTVIESQEQMMKAALEPRQRSTQTEDLSEFPELQEKLKEFAAQHWEDWLEDSIPALGDKTPREAAKTPEGRERLEALLLQFERQDAHMPENSPMRADLDYLRSELFAEETIS